MNRNDVLALLEREGIPYELAEHPAVYTIGEMERLRLPFQARVAKNVFLRDDKKGILEKFQALSPELRK